MIAFIDSIASNQSVSRASALISTSRTSLAALLVLLATAGNASKAIFVEALIVSKTLLPVGVSSLVPSGDGTMLVAGTKSGQILVSTINSEDVKGGPDKWIELPTDEYQPKFPVYSLTFGTDGKVLFAGNGDRFVSTWRLDNHGFRFSNKLGPHTGWVKAVAFHLGTQTLYSIGCNCIESWDCSKDPIRRVSKRAIESSPDFGATLSSDLLCLCLVDGLCLASGGVDGRIHLWSLDILQPEAYCSFPCHSGRVNAMSFSARYGLLFSIGHDGKVCASRPYTESLEWVDSFVLDGSPRLSALCMMQENGDGCKLAMGTTDGQIIAATVEVQDGKVSLTEKSRVQIENNPMIYSICRSRIDPDAQGRFGIYVGHATGMIEVQH